MKDSLQDLLLYIPLHQITFLTPLPKEPVYYEKISECFPTEWLDRPTLLVIQNEEECMKLNGKDLANRFIQDPNLIGLILCAQSDLEIQEEILFIFQQCLLPIIQVEDASSLQMLKQDQKPLYSYGQVSVELVGFMEKGFTSIAAELAKALETPFLYLDENHLLLWQTGKEDELREANRWLNVHRRELENGTYSSSNSSDKSILTMETTNSFDLYSINIAGVINQTLVASAKLVDWQKKLIDKLVGLTALFIQSEEMLREQQERLKEHFVYDLLYHKFESQKVMVKQGKSWGWNLERPHHLLVISIEVSDEVVESMGWMDEILLSIENQKSEMEETIIVFPFQDQVVVLLEDGEDRTISQRKKHVVQIANQLEKGLTRNWPHFQSFIGIGKWYQDTTNLNKSYQEAKLALQFGQEWFENKSVYHINDLGVLRLLIQIHQEILLDFSQEYLIPLIENDRDHGTEYIKTLQVYIRNQGRINEVSEELYIHPNTLRNRLKKIEEMTGIDLQDLEEFMNLIVAVKILSFIK